MSGEGAGVEQQHPAATILFLRVRALLSYLRIEERELEVGGRTSDPDGR